MRWLVVLCLYAAACASPSTAREATRLAPAITSTAWPSDAARAELAAALHGKRFLWVGETEHYDTGRYAVQLTLIDLALHHGVRWLGRELGRADARRVDRFLETGDEHALDEVAIYEPYSKIVARDTLNDQQKRVYDVFGAFMLNERAFWRRVRELSERRAPGTERLHVFGFDDDMKPGSGYDDIAAAIDALPAGALRAELAPLLGKPSADETEAAQAQRLFRATSAVYARAAELSLAIGPERTRELLYDTRALADSCAFDSAESTQRLAAFTARELSMQWRMRAFMRDHPDERAVLLAHAAHLTRSDAALHEAPGRGTAWPRLGPMLEAELPNRSLVVWISVAGGSTAAPSACASPPCEVAPLEGPLGVLRANGIVLASTKQAVFEAAVPIMLEGIAHSAALAKTADYIIALPSDSPAR